MSDGVRTAIRSEIEGISPLDEEERVAISDALAWIDSGAELFRLQKPATPPRHLVSYFVVVDGDHILLVDHINAELWLPTGGHVDPGEHPRETVRREALEELALEAEFLRSEPLFLTATPTVGKTAGHVDVSIWYVLKGDRSKVLRYDESEFHSVRWFPKAGVPMHRTDPQMHRFLEKLG